MENPIKMDDLGVPLFLETPISSSVTGFALSSMVFTIRQFCTASFAAWKSESNCRRSARAQALGGCSRSGIAWKMLLNDLKNQVTLPVKDHMASCKNSPWFFPLRYIFIHGCLTVGDSWLFARPPLVVWRGQMHQLRKHQVGNMDVNRESGFEVHGQTRKMKGYVKGFASGVK